MQEDELKEEERLHQRDVWIDSGKMAGALRGDRQKGHVV